MLVPDFAPDSEPAGSEFVAEQHPDDLLSDSLADYPFVEPALALVDVIEPVVVVVVVHAVAVVVAIVVHAAAAVVVVIVVAVHAAVAVVVGFVGVVHQSQGTGNPLSIQGHLWGRMIRST